MDNGQDKAMQDKTEVERLQGDEITKYGIVAYVTCEMDGVDVTFTDGSCHHFEYGEMI